jgi:hypothetical protein
MYGEYPRGGSVLPQLKTFSVWPPRFAVAAKVDFSTLLGTIRRTHAEENATLRVGATLDKLGIAANALNIA